MMTQDIEFAAFIGLDWDHQKNAVCVLPTDGKPQSSEIEQNPEAIAAWAAELRERFGGRPLAICLEQSRGALVYALMQYEFLVLHPINPKQLSDYRNALYPSGAKSDPADAELLARFLREHSDKLRAWRPDDANTRGLRLLSEQRRKWVQDRVARTNELQQRLKESYPLALELMGVSFYGESFLALLEKFPSQKELQRASPKQLKKLIRKPRRTVDEKSAEEMLDERIAAIRKALPMTTDAAVLEHGRLSVVHLVAAIQGLNRSIAECERKIAELFDKHSDKEVFLSFPGAGSVMAPRLTAAHGTNRDKFDKPEEIQQLSGIAPVTKASGQSKTVHMRWACPKFLKQTFHEFARCSTLYSRWAKAYVDMRRARGNRYHEIVRGLAFKWQRIIFRCWKNHEPYDENRYLQRLEDMLGDDLEAWLEESVLMKRAFKHCALVSGLIERRFPGEEKSGRQVTFSSDLIYNVLRRHQPDHLLLRCAREDMATGSLDVARLGDLLARIRGRIVHIDAPKVTPFAVPILLTIGREKAPGSSEEWVLEMAESELIAEALS